ncbi:hypothetical protein M0R45_024166 [Rubus argutus]|uniref:Uncharacterized protein n=1 Tax=Rubus argutus TaxID=59490 RepID=A0AAW1WQ95_RUBAR
MTNSAGTRGVLCGIEAGDGVGEIEGGGGEEGEEMGVVALTGRRDEFLRVRRSTDWVAFELYWLLSLLPISIFHSIDNEFIGAEKLGEKIAELRKTDHSPFSDNEAKTGLTSSAINRHPRKSCNLSSHPLPISLDSSP